MEFMLGDRQVVKGSENHQWEILNNFCKRETYPDDGNGANITYVEITTFQVNLNLFCKSSMILRRCHDESF